jgi:hemerythrin-like domain-containing protein
MTFHSQVSRLLDDEHRSNLDLLGRVEQAFARGARGGPSPETTRLLADFARHVEHELARHFEFEERELFPRLADAGEGHITALLTEEHDTMREVADELLPLVRGAIAGTLDAAGHDALKRSMFEMIERLVSHIQKETMGLLPMLDHVLDEETDRELAFAHAS